MPDDQMSPTKSPTSVRAERLHKSLFVWDNHACLPMDTERNLEYLPQVKRFARAGCNLVSLNIGYGEISRGDHITLARQMADWIDAHPTSFQQVRSVDDIREARSEERLAIAFDIEGAAVIEDLRDVEMFYDLGVRWISLAYNRNNLYAGGCHDNDTGLSPAGRELVAEMERVGMVVCCSHAGYQTLNDVLCVAEKPVILSHSNPRSVTNHPRNVPDALLKGVAESGGVIGINGLKLFLGKTYDAVRVCEHAMYLLDLVGDEAVGFGLDYVFDLDEIDAEKGSMQSTFPKGCGYEDPVWCFEIDQWPTITARLLDQGVSERTLQQTLGQNWLRVAKACWQ